MSAVLPAGGAGSLDDALQKSEGVWHAAWRRFKQDRVGLSSLVVVLMFVVLIVFAASGLVARGWQNEVGVPNAPPTLLGPAQQQAASTIESPKGPNVDLSDIDPLAPRYKEWAERAKQFQTAETPRAATLPLGGDRLGRDVLAKAIKGTEISVFVGVMGAICATLIGTLLGALAGFGIRFATTIKTFVAMAVVCFAIGLVLGALVHLGSDPKSGDGFSLSWTWVRDLGIAALAIPAVLFMFGGRLGDLLEWLYNVLESIPGILLIFAFAAVLKGNKDLLEMLTWLGQKTGVKIDPGVFTVVIIFALTGWTGLYRQVRAEFIKHASREYVRAAEAIGASSTSRMFRHILPNVSHVILVRMSLLVVAFIKGEVILSYLGLGVSVDQVSWGTMLAEAQSELILGHWWQLVAATAFMAVFVTAFSLMADAWRDALDPKLRGLEK